MKTRPGGLAGLAVAAVVWSTSIASAAEPSSGLRWRVVPSLQGEEPAAAPAATTTNTAPVPRVTEKAFRPPIPFPELTPPPEPAVPSDAEDEPEPAPVESVKHPEISTPSVGPRVPAPPGGALPSPTTAERTERSVPERPIRTVPQPVEIVPAESAVVTPKPRTIQPTVPRAYVPADPGAPLRPSEYGRPVTRVIPAGEAGVPLFTPNRQPRRVGSEYPTNIVPWSVKGSLRAGHAAKPLEGTNAPAASEQPLPAPGDANDPWQQQVPALRDIQFDWKSRGGQ